MKLIILGGFLGSGKTSVLIPLAKEMIEAEGGADGSTKVAIIENEIGQVGIDTAFTDDTGLYTTELFNGCVCCSIAGSLMDSLAQMEEKMHPEWVILETTGLARPGDVAQQLHEYYDEDMNITIFNILDSRRWLKLVPVVGTLIDDQVEAADYVLMNKIDATDAEMLDKVEAGVKEKTNAKIYRVSAVNDKEGLAAVCREIIAEIKNK
ncbi:MAG: cobalamin biosynthesis protein P47K [Lachnospiraceae bacterium]|nr:cobalamin biosynthesis protein P47K [Lachnospiraceae bacterium]MDO4529905.1 GTP-binding protein [Lachnospiraceae bacterium]MDO4733906.1 GTP-binding protein [Lachnospiraceae bacterium]